MEGEGKVLRRNSETEEFIGVSKGINLTLPLRPAFQFRNTGIGPLRILIATMPPWPGPQEADKSAGPWLPTVTPDAEKTDEEKGSGEP